MRRWRSRKARLRVERTENEPIRGEWRGRFVFTLTLHNRLDGSIHSLDFYLSQKRVNSYRVDVDGRPWKKQIGATRVLSLLRKKLPQFRLQTS